MRLYIICLSCILYAIFILTGCTSALKVISNPIDRLPLHVSDPTPLKLKPVQFVVIHKDNAEAIFAEMEKQGFEPVLFALTGTDYKALAVNIDSIKTFIILQREIIREYKKYYEP